MQRPDGKTVTDLSGNNNHRIIHGNAIWLGGKGLFASPSNHGTVEAIYYHDGSSLSLSGYATVLDCLSYCGRAGSMEFIITGDGKEIWRSGFYNPKCTGKTI